MSIEGGAVLLFWLHFGAPRICYAAIWLLLITPKFKPQARKILHPFLLKAAILPVYLATSIKNTAKSPLAFIVKIITIVTQRKDGTRLEVQN